MTTVLTRSLSVLGTGAEVDYLEQFGMSSVSKTAFPEVYVSKIDFF